jgi:hypothetical protein
MSRRALEGENALLLQFTDDILNAPFAQTGKGTEILVAAAVKSIGLSLGFAIHQAVNRKLAGG